MIVYDSGEWNVINLMTIIGVLEMNYTINELIILHMCFKKWNVVQYVQSMLFFKCPFT
jgi:hypothetical protein